ncbi:MAG: LytTR family transcriptional regulator DNA-binding domain-containing protein [Lachnospiraceae bacterium]|nr:LytTR family transcriptional regulator DNA-binding domain-containing protein [Lachnospiraceae bacterium]
MLTQSVVARLPLCDINYFLGEGRRTRIVMKGGGDYRMGEKITFFERFMDEAFYRQGKYYINLSNVVSVTSDAEVTFDDGTKIYFTKKTYVGLKQSFARFILEGR